MDPEPCSVLEMLWRAIHMLKSYKKDGKQILHSNTRTAKQLYPTTNVTYSMDVIKTFTELTNIQAKGTAKGTYSWSS